MKALVIGAGIGGVAATIALCRAGADAHLFERAPKLQEVGAGIAVWPNALRALDALGIRTALEALAIPQLGGGIHTWDGELLLGQSGTALRERYGAPTVIAHRAELLDVLIKALPADRVHVNAELLRFEDDGEEIAAHFADGTVERAAVLIGADGVRSTVRGQIFPTVRPTYAGYTAWRAVAQFEDAPTATFWGESWGVGLRFGLMPLRGGRAYWFCTRNAAEGHLVPEADRKARLAALFHGWHPPIATLIDRTPADAILQNDIYELPPLRRWVKGRVTLLGDAAHAMTPNLGQGACQALEDAVALGAGFAGANDVSAALNNYEAQRVARANTIVVRSRRIGVVGQWQNPLACALRNRLVKWSAPLQMRQLDSVIGGFVTTTT